ncbi:MAG: stage II sporulation protein R [Oscillospiraceae bacterium]|nr:stage II sporulation protein R [Oscillospiraceae bacterium]
MDKKFKLWEISLIIGLICAVALGAWAQRSQRELSEKLLRLHVVANSDSEADQALKLSVRDRVLELAEPIISGAGDIGEAAEALEANLPFIIGQAQAEVKAMGYDLGVGAEITDGFFPTRDYGEFSLPAGKYRALRVTIGEGGGENWWCVVFPPLCGEYGAFSEAAKQAGLSDDEITLIAESGGVKLRFRCIELLERLRKFLSA